MKNKKLKIKGAILFCIGWIILSNLNAQEKYHRVSIGSSIQKLREHEIAIDHYHTDKNAIVCELSDFDIQLLKQAEIPFKILIEDITKFYQQSLYDSTLIHKKIASLTCNTNLSVIDKYTTPTDFTLGSMGGYFTYAEFLGHLDNMTTKYPNLITSKLPIDTFTSHEGRPIYWIKISDNPTMDETEPEVLYTSIHHAREPASLSQLIFYMYYLLENYTSNSHVKYLVDNTEMYFVPMINPDGYIYNETTNPGGGGMWRKNRRNHGDGTYGVDLNRNYAYEWGGLGTSSSTNSDIYRGSFAFSEPETQAIKYFVENHTFQFALNYHTYSDLLLYPFGYDNNKPTPDQNYFESFTPILVSENGYDNIISSLLYPASGTSDDWMYGDSLKNKVLAMTPEVGNASEGFWPPSSKIIELCKENILANLTVADLTLHYAKLNVNNSNYVENLSSYITYDLTCLGLAAPSNFTLNILPISSNIQSVGSAKTYTGMNLMQQISDSISFNLYSSTTFGEEIKFLWQLNNGTYVYTDTITLIYQQFNAILYDPAESMTQWSAPFWNTTNEKYYTANYSITDSPYSNYLDNQINSITINNAVDLSGVTNAILKFYATWDIEKGYDYAQIEISENSGLSWTPLCGKYSSEGTVYQDYLNPVYDGIQDWVFEEIDLIDYIGSTVLFRFKIVSDGFVTSDGFYFDEFKVSTSTNVTNIPLQKVISTLEAYPNPANNNLYIKNIPHGIYTVEWQNNVGYKTIQDNVYIMNTLEVPETMNDGIYYIKLSSKNNQNPSSVLKVIIVK